MNRKMAVLGFAAVCLCAGAATAQDRFDPLPAWPLCGRITEDPPAGWDETQGCPEDRWGNPDHTDLPLQATFGPRQLASDSYRYDYHRGIDLETPLGTPVFAIADGKVRKAGHSSSYTDPLVQIRHYRPGYSSCSSGDGCYTTNYMHMYDWVVSVGQSVGKGELIGYSGESSSSGYDHIEFEIRDAPSWDKYSAWQTNCIHPLDVLVYDDAGGANVGLEITEVDVTDPHNPRVTATVTMPGGVPLDLQRVDVFVYEIQPDQSLVEVIQPGTEPNTNGYHVNPPWFDVNIVNAQYTHKNSSRYPWSSFDDCPYAHEHGPSYDANVHLDTQHPDDMHVGSFNGIWAAPEPFNDDTEWYVLGLTFTELVGIADSAGLCLVVEATTTQSVSVTEAWNCP